MILIRQLCSGATCSAIGHFLGRDHTTVLYGLRKAGERLAKDQDFARLYQGARECCVGGGRIGRTTRAPIAGLTLAAAKFPPYDAETGHESRSR
jgi:hypothetical protein